MVPKRTLSPLFHTVVEVFEVKYGIFDTVGSSEKVPKRSLHKL